MKGPVGYSYIRLAKAFVFSADKRDELPVSRIYNFIHLRVAARTTMCVFIVKILSVFTILSVVKYELILIMQKMNLYSDSARALIKGTKAILW